MPSLSKTSRSWRVRRFPRPSIGPACSGRSGAEEKKVSRSFSCVPLIFYKSGPPSRGSSTERNNPQRLGSRKESLLFFVNPPEPALSSSTRLRPCKVRRPPPPVLPCMHPWSSLSSCMPLRALSLSFRCKADPASALHHLPACFLVASSSCVGIDRTRRKAKIWTALTNKEIRWRVEDSRIFGHALVVDDVGEGCRRPAINWLICGYVVVLAGWPSSAWRPGSSSSRPTSTSKQIIARTRFVCGVDRYVLCGSTSLRELIFWSASRFGSKKPELFEPLKAHQSPKVRCVPSDRQIFLREKRNAISYEYCVQIFQAVP